MKKILGLLTILLTNSYGFVPISTQLNKRNAHCPVYKSNNDDSDNDDKFDPIENIGEFMGYPPERKWKGVRMATYSIGLGFLLGEFIKEIQHPDAEIANFFMNN